MRKRTKKLLLVGAGLLVGGGLIYAATRQKRPQLLEPVGLAFGKDVSPEFRARIVEVGQNVQINPSYLMTVMYKESGIKSHIHIIPVGRDANGNVIYKRSEHIPIEEGTIGGGLIGFMRKTAIGLGTDLGTLLALDGVDQLDYVEKFFYNHRKSGVIGPNPSLWQLYMSNFLPAYADHADEPNFVVAAKDSQNKKSRNIYEHNPNADRNKDRKITVAEAMAGIDAILKKGLSDKHRF